MKTKSIILVGVGGQGSVVASRILGNLLLSQGFDAKVSEVHGMSQRGGAVSTYVKYGKEVHSPVVEKGEADIMVAFEQMEAARWLSYLKIGGKLIVSTQKLPPMPVITGAAQYNENIIDKIKALGVDTISVDALGLAVQAGNARTSNVVMMGVLSNIMDFELAAWQKALEESVPPKALEENKKAFELGRNISEKVKEV
ncbi:MAG: indolepyruvate oxidoreductase subunit beta [Oscillospiraceae bacterium]|nr:indolepyruvate oxidoreductase subunit beta [Oscillospiraceae bacterium]